MTNTTPWKSTWAAVAVAALFTLFLGVTPHMNAADSKVRLTKKEVKTLVATAKTPEDHMKLARYFNQEADQLEAEAKEHDELAQEYRKNPNPMASKLPMSGRTAEHCAYFAKSTREAAKAARELAAAHEQMAKDAAK
ncbi:MAG: hypothetical protein ABSC05_24225 [Candidatus Solibacter sp.]|jgi:hypothetical protein